MNKREQLKRPIKFFASATVIVLLTSIYMYVWYHFYNETGVKYFVRGNYVIIGLYAVLLTAFYGIYGGFKLGRARIFDLLYSQILAILTVNIITYLQLCLICRWQFMTNTTPLLLMTVVEAVAILLWTLLVSHFSKKLYPPEKLLVIYGKFRLDVLLAKLASRPDKFDVQETISANEDFEYLKEKVLGYKSILLADIPSEVRNKLLKHCFENDIRCYSVPKIPDIMIMAAENMHLFDTSLLLFRNHGLTLDQRFVKRTFDILVSLTALLVFSPFMVIIAIAIKLYDGGPVFYTQDRLTRNHETFQVYKFRSMRVAPPDAEVCMTRKNDDRITPVGKIIRNTHFDELPQLFNILKGDMSVVGPRPERPEIAEKYYSNIPEFAYRLKVKGGLTGYAQIYGKYNTTPYDKLKLDLTYIEKYSFLLDLKLILLTIKVLFQNEDVVGIDANQTTAANHEQESANK